jgi:hypothetical protein
MTDLCFRPKALKQTHLTPMRKGDAFREPSQNKSQGRLIGVDSLNLACKGLLLEKQARGLAPKAPQRCYAHGAVLFWRAQDSPLAPSGTVSLCTH